MFQLTKDEWESLKCQIGISNTRGGDRRSLPYVFTEQGVSQLSAILHSDFAEDISVKIIRAFVAMRRFLTANANLFQRVDNLERRQTETDNKLDVVLDKRKADVDCVVHTRFNNQTELDFAKHNAQCAEIGKVQLPQHIHDRYLIVDDEVWLLGASAKDMGHGLCTVIKVGFTPDMVLGMLK